MSAFNDRFRPSEIFGVDLRALLALLLAFLLLIFSILLTLWAVKIMAATLALAAFMAAVFILLWRNRLPWLNVFYEGRVDQSCCLLQQEERL